MPSVNSLTCDVIFYPYFLFVSRETPFFIFSFFLPADPWEHVIGMGLGSFFVNQLVQWDAKLAQDLDKMLEKAKAANERRYIGLPRLSLSLISVVDSHLSLMYARPDPFVFGCELMIEVDFFKICLKIALREIYTTGNLLRNGFFLFFNSLF